MGKISLHSRGANLDPSHCWLINIGDDVALAPRVQILAHDASTCKHLGYAKIGRISIGDRVFIGAGSIILPNVTIGSDIVIGAGSVVAHFLLSGGMCTGNPTRLICSLDDYLDKRRTLISSSPVYEEDYTLHQIISRLQSKNISGSINHTK